MTNVTLNPQQPRTAEMAARMDEVKGRSLWADARARFLRNKAAMVSIFVLALVVLFAFFGQHLSAFDNETIDWDVLGNVEVLGKPSLANGHFFFYDAGAPEIYTATDSGCCWRSGAVNTSTVLGTSSTGNVSPGLSSHTTSAPGESSPDRTSRSTTIAVDAGGRRAAIDDVTVGDAVGPPAPVGSIR